MASANGVLSPQPHLNVVGASPQLSAKRKRAESTEPSEQMNGTSDSKERLRSQSTSQDPQEQIAEFIEILKIHDVTPSVLSRQLPIRELSAEPHPKRKKTEPDTDAATIITRAASGKYSKLDDVLCDITNVCSSMLDELHLPNGVARTQYAPSSPSISALAAKVKVFKLMAEHIVESEKTHRDRKCSVHTEKSSDLTKPLTNGATPSSTVTQLSTSPGDNKVVLTLFGNAPGAKQLFSSLQQSVKAVDGASDVVQPLREAGLPNGISTTQIVPLQAAGLVDEKKRVPTMGELFSTSTSATPFQPPKPSQIASTRSSNVGWYKPAELDRIRSRSNQSYFGQTITCGEWLDYAGTSSSLDAKRRQRERALSLGGGKVSAASTNSAEQEAAKLEALFRSAYSGFAPVKDNTAAIVPEGLLGRIWWQRAGEKQFERLVSNNVNMASAITGGISGAEAEIGQGDKGLNEIEEVQRVIEDWDEVIDPSLEPIQEMPKPIQDKDVEEILHEISELLETLNSYQRIRNLSLNPPPRSGSTSSAADPTKPSEAEIATYQTLKAQLSLMIAMLPPYAVAKLNSDRLAELNISTKIQVLTDSYKGVMEEDEAAARAKVAEMRAASSSRAAPQTSVHRSSSSLYGNQYASPARPSIPSGQQYYPQAQTPVRPPSTSIQRPPATAPAPYPGQRQPAPTSYRPQTTYSTPTYPHQLPRTSQPQYGATGSQQYFQTPTSTNYGQVSNPNYSGGPQPSLSARYQASSAAYQPGRVQQAQNGMDYRYSNGSNPHRQASPQKPHVYSPQPQVAQPRPYGTPTPSVSQEQRYFQPPITNGNSALAQTQGSSQAAGTLGATGYHTVMSEAQQASIVARQRAQLEQQQGMQQHARHAAQAGAMNAPSGSQINGGSVVTATH